DVAAIIAQQGPDHASHRGTQGADTITGTSADDVIDGRGGNDILRGWRGSDRYLFGVGSGNDVIQEDGFQNDGEPGKLINLNPADVLIGRSGYDLLITIVATGEVLKVEGHFNLSIYGIEQLVFANGTTWDRATIQANTVLRGTSGADTIVGTGDGDVID